MRLATIAYVRSFIIAARTCGRVARPATRSRELPIFLLIFGAPQLGALLSGGSCEAVGTGTLFLTCSKESANESDTKPRNAVAGRLAHPDRLIPLSISASRTGHRDAILAIAAGVLIVVGDRRAPAPPYFASFLASVPVEICSPFQCSTLELGDGAVDVLQVLDAEGLPVM